MKYLLSLLVAANLFAITPQDLYGCFETIEHNQQSVPHGPDYERNLSTYEDYSFSRTYKNVETNRVEPINVFNFFTGVRDDVYYSYSPIILFQDLGEYKWNDNSLSYEIDEDIYMYRSQKEMYEKVDHRLKLSIEKVGVYFEGSVELKSYARRINRSFTFKLKKVSCPTSY
ncbi:hypothetical protein [Halobacteriovorax sp. CON-3]|uniref:hypothetical protein n=1 Tax=Halobacteriovorax sp. CON-3 TaxID=3157710 RepID=UPI0037148322